MPFSAWPSAYNSSLPFTNRLITSLLMAGHKTHMLLEDGDHGSTKPRTSKEDDQTRIERPNAACSVKDHMTKQSSHDVAAHSASWPRHSTTKERTCGREAVGGAWRARLSEQRPPDPRRKFPLTQPKKKWEETHTRPPQQSSALTMDTAEAVALRSMAHQHKHTRTRHQRLRL